MIPENPTSMFPSTPLVQFLLANPLINPSQNKYNYFLSYKKTKLTKLQIQKNQKFNRALKYGKSKLEKKMN